MSFRSLSSLSLPLFAVAVSLSACTMSDQGGSAVASSASAANSANPMVGGAAMYPTRNIVENAVNSADHTTLVAAVQAAGLVETLSSPGPFTVFAPTNAAFDALPEGTVATLLQPENKATLTRILTYHVVAGRMTAADLAAKTRMTGGQAELTTVAGAKLTVSQSPSGGWMLTDTKGGTANITIADVMQSNGVIHEIDAVVMP